MDRYNIGDTVVNKRNGREYQITGFKTFVIGDKEESYVYLSFSGGKTQYGGEYLNLFFDNFEVKK